MKKRHRMHIKSMRVLNHFFKPNKSIRSFSEEVNPCGERDRLIHRSFYKPIHGSSNLSDVLVSQPASHPWFIVLWEPLNTKAPNPQKANPYCCYSNTIVFYVRGYILRPFSTIYGGLGAWRLESPGQRFEEWDKTTTRLKWDDYVEYNKELFKVGGGSVVWAQKRWWMRHIARRTEDHAN